MQKIKDLRFKIDEIDEKLLGLIIERLKTVKKIGEVKRENGIRVIDRNREKEILMKLTEAAKNKGLNPEVIKKVWRMLMEISYEVEGEKNGRG